MRKTLLSTVTMLAVVASTTANAHPSANQHLCNAYAEFDPEHSFTQIVTMTKDGRLYLVHDKEGKLNNANEWFDFFAQKCKRRPVRKIPADITLKEAARFTVIDYGTTVPGPNSYSITHTAFSMWMCPDTTSVIQCSPACGVKGGPACPPIE